LFIARLAGPSESIETLPNIVRIRETLCVTQMDVRGDGVVLRVECDGRARLKLHIAGNGANFVVIVNSMAP
jgi:hypothetical protein